MTFRRDVPTRSGPSELWSETRALVARGAVLPIVSNYLLPKVFNSSLGEIAASWAAEIESPLSDHDNRNLARVAQVYSVRSDSLYEARVEYHNALKGYLLSTARQAGGVADPDYLESLLSNPSQVGAVSFSQLARDLGYPRYADPTHNPMRLLAELPLSIYLTTSQHAFQEFALAQTGHKDPVSEIFYWDQAHRTIPSIFEREPDYRPSVERPLVYHLFGIDTYPESMVLSEDDYLSVLMRLSELKRQVKVSEVGGGPDSAAKYDLPAEVKAALSGAGLLLLGYQIDDWEFRVLFRWLVRYTGPSREGRGAPEGVCIQVRPAVGGDGAERNRRILEYLTQFFKQNKFGVYWGDPDTCVLDLWSRWRHA